MEFHSVFYQYFSECGDWSLSLLPMMMEIEFSRTDRETRSTPTFRRKRFARRGEVGGVGGVVTVERVDYFSVVEKLVVKYLLTFDCFLMMLDLNRVGYYLVHPC